MQLLYIFTCEIELYFKYKLCYISNFLYFIPLHIIKSVMKAIDMKILIMSFLILNLSFFYFN